MLKNDVFSEHEKPYAENWQDFNKAINSLFLAQMSGCLDFSIPETLDLSGFCFGFYCH